MKNEKLIYAVNSMNLYQGTFLEYRLEMFSTRKKALSHIENILNVNKAFNYDCDSYDKECTVYTYSTLCDGKEVRSRHTLRTLPIK